MSTSRPRLTWTAAGLTAALATSLLWTGTTQSARATVGTTAPDIYAFTAKLVIGEGDPARACSGVLVDPLWVLTSKSCFATDATGTVAAGKPKQKTTITVGRTDLSATAGLVTEAVELLPRAERDVVMVKLAKRASNIDTVDIATTPPEAGEELQMAGFGRTKTEWTPNKLRVSTFTVSAASPTTLAVAPKTTGTLCKGDMGGPALRERGGNLELAGLHTRAWQGGCLGETETRTDGVSTRTDDIADWIQQIRLSDLVPNVSDVMTSADFNGDGRADIAAVTNDGNLHAFHGRTDRTFEYGRALWKQDGSWKSVKKLIGGDFNGDGHADVASVWSDGSLQLYAGQASGSFASAKRMWPDGTDWSGMLDITRFKPDKSSRDGLITIWNNGGLYAYSAAPDGTLSGTKRNMWPDNSWKGMKLFTAADFTGDRLDDVIGLTSSGTLARYDGNAQGGLNKGVSIWPDNTWGKMQIHAADFDGDGKADILGRWDNGMNLYRGDGAGKIAPGTPAWPTLP